MLRPSAKTTHLRLQRGLPKSKAYFHAVAGNVALQASVYLGHCGETGRHAVLGTTRKARLGNPRLTTQGFALISLRDMGVKKSEAAPAGP